MTRDDLREIVEDEAANGRTDSRVVDVVTVEDRGEER